MNGYVILHSLSSCVPSEHKSVNNCDKLFNFHQSKKLISTRKPTFHFNKLNISHLGCVYT